MKYICYSIALIWFTASCITGSFLVRMGVSFVFFYVSVVFLVSILRIRQTLARVKPAVDVQTNKILINLSLVTFFGEAVIFFVLFTLSLIQNLDHDATEEELCKTSLALTITYWFMWVNVTARSCLTSYMNIKFSKSLRQADQEFNVVFNQSQSQAI